MHSLYWRIFLAFWAALALILVGTVTVAVNAGGLHRLDRPWVQRAELYAQAARAYESGGPAALRNWLAGLAPAEALARTFVIGPDGQDLLRRAVPRLLYGPPGASGAGLAAQVRVAPIGGALVLMAPGGGSYHVIVGPLRDHPRLFGELELPGVPLATLLIALGVSAVVCYLLARYLTAPVDRLRRATQRLAAGDLDVRVSRELDGRNDDLARLAADLDTMSERLRNLLESRQQLLRDVSHELRSPLARLQLALSLAQRDPAQAPRQLERVRREADRLEQLIQRTLTLARLERPTALLECKRLDLSAMLTRIADEVAIEAESRHCRVLLSLAPALHVAGDAELLRSAIENVLRNALRYAPEGSAVSIAAGHAGGDPGRLQVSIADRGPGVPPGDLSLIFEPFYRVGSARDRPAGGDGLGLAIAARALAAHGGSIRAANAPEGGLVVTLCLPAAVAAVRCQPSASPVGAA